MGFHLGMDMGLMNELPPCPRQASSKLELIRLADICEGEDVGLVISGGVSLNKTQVGTRLTDLDPMEPAKAFAAFSMSADLTKIQK